MKKDSIGVPSILKALFFDYPNSVQDLEDIITRYNIHSIQDIKRLPPPVQWQFRQLEGSPVWNGFINSGLTPSPMFEKITQGQVWRLFSPCVIHRDYLHFLFNMGWVLILGSQIEARLKKWKMILLIILIGVFSNIAQYLMGGPYFLGFSGVIAGLTAFIWARQRKAPEEGYPLSEKTILFLFWFVLIMAFLEVISFLLQVFSVASFSFSIANTAHLVGGFVGFLLGRCNFFSGRVV